MLGLVLYAILIISGAAIFATHTVFEASGILPAWAANILVGGGTGALLALIISLAWRTVRVAVAQEKALMRICNSLIIGVFATLFGLIAEFSVSFLLPPSTGAAIARGGILLAFLGFGLAIGYILDQPMISLRRSTVAPTRAHKNGSVSNKVIDTSAIIDGRIGDLLQTGFVEGDVIVPEFVLAELQNVADSSNSLRRRKGRRGLEILRELMEDDQIRFRVSSRDYPTVKEVDRKLIHLAREENGTLITTDYNLNRVAQVEGVKVLNINELANTVKPRFIPGESIDVEVIDRGEEIGQGIGYLDDGTMVVVENGRRHIGRKITATVKSALQTEAGRMLFVEPNGESPRWER
jgi:uncharacterized protein YacL